MPAIARLGARRGWTRPVAWLGSALGIFGSVLFSIVLLPDVRLGIADHGRVLRRAGRADGRDRPSARCCCRARSSRTSRSGWPRPQRIPALALPDETPEDVLDLARAFPGTHLAGHRPASTADWPAILDGGTPGTGCFRELDLGPGPAGEADPLAGTRAFEIVCP